MYQGKKILAVIPARGGSKGIPRKNTRMLCGKPLIAYSIKTALNSEYVDTVLLSSDDEEIIEIANIFGAKTLKRPMQLAGDDVSLDPVIFHALINREKEEGLNFDFVISMQPTAPLLSHQTLDEAIREIIDRNCDALIGVRDETHLYWTKKNNDFIPLYKERLNRQFLDPIYKETGLFISKRSIVNKYSRIGGKISIFAIPFEESIDIDTNLDWWLVESIIKNIKIAIRVDSDIQLGLGHVYRGITLANRILNNVHFIMNEEKYLGIEKVKEYNHKIITFKDEVDMYNELLMLNPDIVINDILDTSYQYMCKLNEMGYYTVNFEDLGIGSKYADIVINALYERTDPPENSYFGYKYICLRDEFFIFPFKDVTSDVNEILIIFGGSDPNDLTLRTLRSIEKLGLTSVRINIILGLGYEYYDDLQKYINELINKHYKIEVNKNIKIMAKHIVNADVAITSNGRTVYEIASLGVPCISISQNEREMSHLFSYICGGVKNLGIESNVTEQIIALTLKEIIDNYNLRKHMSDSMAEFNLKKGTDRVMNLIFDKYWEKQGHEYN